MLSQLLAVATLSNSMMNSLRWSQIASEKAGGVLKDVPVDQWIFTKQLRCLGIRSPREKDINWPLFGNTTSPRGILLSALDRASLGLEGMKTFITGIK
jgi:hypothetical protein